jgi:GH3 auxin-responsive promoter
MRHASRCPDVRALLANAAWLAVSAPHRHRFLARARHVDAVQAERLARIVSANAGTEFGRVHGFDRIRDMQEYRRRVPVRTYEEFAPWIDRAAGGRPGVLTSEPVLLFEPTGGSSGGAKLIPYTRSLQLEFERAIAVWIADIFMALPAALRGTSYWSISPPVHARRVTAGGIPIGFADDIEYLGGKSRWIRHAMAAPPDLARVTEPDAFLDAAAIALLRRADLAVVSVWNPSFLSVLLARIRAQWGAFARALRDGACGPLPPRRPEPERAREIERALGGAGAGFADVWPWLRLVSCWTDAAARPFARQLERELPGVRMQGKGLLATEGFVSIPLFEAGGCVPAYTSHVLEFLDDAGDSHGAGDLARGEEYAVVLTTGGGLFRYALGDRVRVTGAHAGLPVIEFVGRPRTSDLVGEKLDARHVQRVVDDALVAAGWQARFAMLAPDVACRPPGYVLYVQTEVPRSEHGASAIVARAVERGLTENVQYDHARRMGQLGAARVFKVRAGAIEAFLCRSAAEGQAVGDVKPTVLERRTGWTPWFTGAMLPPPNVNGASLHGLLMTQEAI